MNLARRSSVQSDLPRKILLLLIIYLFSFFLSAVFGNRFFKCKPRVYWDWTTLTSDLLKAACTAHVRAPRYSVIMIYDICSKTSVGKRCFKCFSLWNAALALAMTPGMLLLSWISPPVWIFSRFHWMLF